MVAHDQGGANDGLWPDSAQPGRLRNVSCPIGQYGKRTLATITASTAAAPYTLNPVTDSARVFGGGKQQLFWVFARSITVERDIICGHPEVVSKVA